MLVLFIVSAVLTVIHTALSLYSMKGKRNDRLQKDDLRPSVK